MSERQYETWPEIRRRHEAEKWELVHSVWCECRNQAETARRLKMHRGQVQRMFSVWHDPPQKTEAR